MSAESLSQTSFNAKLCVKIETDEKLCTDMPKTKFHHSHNAECASAMKEILKDEYRLQHICAASSTAASSSTAALRLLISSNDLEPCKQLQINAGIILNCRLHRDQFRGEGRGPTDDGRGWLAGCWNVACSRRAHRCAAVAVAYERASCRPALRFLAISGWSCSRQFCMKPQSAPC